MRLPDNQSSKSDDGIPKCVAYKRVSTSDQVDSGASLEVQETKILEKVTELKGELVEVYHDDGKSGTNMNRPGLSALLARCSKKDIRYLIVYDTSRLSRDTKDYLTIKALLVKFEVEVVPLTGMSSNGSDPYAKFFDEILAAVNALQPRISGYKAKQTATEKFKAGFYPSWAPIGYKNVANKNNTGSYDKRIVVPDAHTAPFITQAFKMYATRDYSIFDIRQYLHKNGVKGKKGRALQFSVAHHMLRNPFYYGLMRHGGLEGMGKHALLIDEETFNLVQKVLNEKGDYALRKRKHNFLLRGIIFCKDCGRRYVAEWHYHEKYKTGNGRIGMYHCSQTGKRGRCPSRCVLLTDLEAQVEYEIAKLEFKPDFIETVQTNIRKVYNDSVGRDKITKKAIYNRRDAVEMKREKLEQEMLNNNVGGDAFKRMNAKLDAELLAIQKELAIQSKVKTFDVSAIDEVLSFTQNIIQTYNQSDVDHKRAYLHFFFEKIWVKDKKIMEVEYTPAIKVLNEAKLGILSTNWLAPWDDFRQANWAELVEYPEQTIQQMQQLFHFG